MALPTTTSPPPTAVTPTTTTQPPITQPPETTVPPTTAPPKEPSLELDWKIDLSENKVDSTSVSDEGLYIAALFEDGMNYLIDPSGNTVWNAMFEGGVDYVNYRYDIIPKGGQLTFYGPYKSFRPHLKDVGISPDCSYIVVGVDEALEKYSIIRV